MNTILRTVPGALRNARRAGGLIAGLRAARSAERRRSVGGRGW